MSNEQINQETFKSALDFALQLRDMDIHWDELSDIAGMVSKIQSALDSRQETNLLDVEDVLQEIVVNVRLYNMRRDFGQAVYWVIDRHEKKSESSPNFVELRGHMNDDDLQACGDLDDLKIDNDMSAVHSPECGPGSDMHIACIDIEDKLGEKSRNVFEARLTGAGRVNISNALGYTYEEVRWCEKVVKQFLENGEYTLDCTNRRLGTAKEFEANRTFFPADRRTQRTWDVPDVDHRSTRYVEPFEFDNTPIAPCGDEQEPSVLIFDNGIPAVDLRIDVAFLDTEIREEKEKKKHQQPQFLSKPV